MRKHRVYIVCVMQDRDMFRKGLYNNDRDEEKYVHHVCVLCYMTGAKRIVSPET